MSSFLSIGRAGARLSRPRFAVRHAVAILAIAVLASLNPAAVPPVAAQGFFDLLFGGGGPAPKSYSAPRPRAPAASPWSPSGAFSAPQRSYARGDDDADGSDGDEGRASGGRMRTVCVRLCDGYYWPVSFSTSRGRLNRDASVCRSSCGDEARLFYMSSPRGEIDDAVDLAGRSYAKLDTAFRYRKSLVPGCACRPEPWSAAEMQRHASYAAREAGPAGATFKPTAPAVTIIAGNYDRPRPPVGAGTLAQQAQSLDPAPVPPAEKPALSGPPTLIAAAQTPAMREQASESSEPARPEARSPAAADASPALAAASPRRTARREPSAPRQAPPRGRVANVSANQGGFFGLGGPASGNLVWPGDVPRSR